MTEQSEQQVFMDAAVEVLKAFPNSSPTDLAASFQHQIEGDPPSPLKKIDTAAIPAMVRHFHTLEKIAGNPDHLNSLEVVKATAKTILVPAEYVSFVKTNRL